MVRQNSKILNVLFIGDIFGRPGREITKEILPQLKQELAIDLTITNGENAAGGVGITEKVYNELVEMGIDIITTGNHIWDKKEFIKEIARCPRLIRPANYPPGTPGLDRIIYKEVGVVNLCGRVFMQSLDCPFRVGEAIINELKKETKIIIVDVHAEATSEKSALGWFLDGKVSAVIGTHTHVQTADERLLLKGTAFISDAGMVGAYNSTIGVENQPILERFLTQMPCRFEPEQKGPGIFNAVLLKIDTTTGKALEIKRIVKIVPEQEGKS